VNVYLSVQRVLIFLLGIDKKAALWAFKIYTKTIFLVFIPENCVCSSPPIAVEAAV
jgi:hypothetical protein